MINLLQFFQSPEGENSSKRLVGILASIVLFIVIFISTFHFINSDKNQELLELISGLEMFISVLLISGLTEIYLKKYGNKSNNNNNNIGN